MVYNGYYKVMSNSPKMGHLPIPVPVEAKCTSPTKWPAPQLRSSAGAWSSKTSSRSSLELCVRVIGISDEARDMWDTWGTEEKAVFDIKQQKDQENHIYNIYVINVM